MNSKIVCDGCGRGPTLKEWFRAEILGGSYGHWRHPGIAFKEAGVETGQISRAKFERLFRGVFGRPLPEEPSYLCPECQVQVAQDLPDLAAKDPGDEYHPSTPRY